jgi:hypothetical protein
MVISMKMSIGLMMPESMEVSKEGKQRAIDYWMYGDDKFEELAEAWGKEVEDAELMRCANCEYYDNRVTVLKALDGDSGQGFCKKFEFLCSDEASCQAWEGNCEWGMDDAD